MTHSPPSALKLTATWLGLLGLTGLSFLLSRARLGPLEFVAALGIAAVKSSLVVVIFMQWLAERSVARFVVFVAAFYVLLLGSLTAADVATRLTFPRAPMNPIERR
jgi:cytochrome c oxidase subunit IV